MTFVLIRYLARILGGVRGDGNWEKLDAQSLGEFFIAFTQTDFQSLVFSSYALRFQDP